MLEQKGIGVIHNSDDFNFNDIMWGIKYVFRLYLQ